MTAELAPPVSCDAAELLQKAAGAQGPGRRGQCHRRRRRAGTYERAGGIEPSPRRRHRADPANHLPRQEPHRAAERDDGSGGARHPQPPPSHRRRSKGRRPARHQAGLRHRFKDPDRDRAPAARSRQAAHGAKGGRQAPSSSLAPPTCRSIRRPAGSPVHCSARSNPVRNSPRRNSAWMPQSCAAMSARSKQPASPNSSPSSSASIRCARPNPRRG